MSIKLDINYDWLYQKYIVEKLSSIEISKIKRCSSGTIRDWLKKYNIEIRNSWFRRKTPSKLILHLTRLGKNQQGKNHPRWKEKIKDSYGYVLIFNKNHPNSNKQGYVKEHRLIIERKIGRYLNKEEVVHHLDFDRSNNNSENLYIFSNESEHQKYHNFLKKIVRGFINEQTEIKTNTD